MEDFVFGTLATDDQRLAYQRARRGGVTHDFLRTPYAPRPGQPVQVELLLGPGQPFDRAWVYWSIDGADPAGSAGQAVHGQAAAMEKADVEWDMLEWGYIQRYRAILPAQPEGALVRYNLSAGARDGSEAQADGGKVFAYYVTNLGLPEWARQAVIYQIMPDRFCPGTGKTWKTPPNPAGFYGGTLRGIAEKLDYIAGLGANVLWLTPIFPSPSHHGYDATDLFSIEPRLGTKEDLRLLLDAAHQRGIRLLLDLVPNHLSSLHWSFQEAISDRHSPRAEWYSFRHWPDDYETFFGVKDLPQLNLRNPGARQHMLDAAAYWLEFGVDGYRVDYAVGPAPDFWADLRRVCTAVKPDCWTFGEVVEPSVSQRNFYGLLNGALDFMLLEALRKTFAFQSWSAVQFLSFLERHEAYFPPDFSRPSFLDNHDMNRFLWAVRGDRQALKLAALCQFTLSQPAVIYYGTEAGLSQERDVRQAGRGLPEESRLPMVWGDDQDGELLEFYRSLIRLRQAEDWLPAAMRQALQAGPGLLAYQQTGKGAALAVVINLTGQVQPAAIPGSWSKTLLATQAMGKLTTRGGMTQLDLPPGSGVILK
jgi:glycosidase